MIKTIGNQIKKTIVNFLFFRFNHLIDKDILKIEFPEMFLEDTRNPYRLKIHHTHQPPKDTVVLKNDYSEEIAVEIDGDEDIYISKNDLANFSLGKAKKIRDINTRDLNNKIKQLEGKIKELESLKENTSSNSQLPVSEAKYITLTLLKNGTIGIKLVNGNKNRGYTRTVNSKFDLQTFLRSVFELDYLIVEITGGCFYLHPAPTINTKPIILVPDSEYSLPELGTKIFTRRVLNQ